MALRDDLLTPIAGSNAAGTNLRYDRKDLVYDKIKEARREDDDAPQGDWVRTRKLADWPLAIKLITEALAEKSKDLQLAAWLTEALLRRDGVAGLKEGLDLLHGLTDKFWETLYPEIEDGDVELRAAPLQWIGDRLEQPLKNAPLTRSGLDFYKYKESRAVGSEEDASKSDEKLAARQAAIADGKLTREEFDLDVGATPKAFYVNLIQTFDATQESLSALVDLCDIRFGDDRPSFGRLRDSLEEVRHAVSFLLQEKRKTEPDAVEEAATEAEPAQAEEQNSGGAPVRSASAGKALTEEPIDREDAVRRVVSAARYLRREDPYSPASYLMLRGLRWGEVRACGQSIDPAMLEPPPGAIRQQLKRMAMDANWAEVLESAEAAMGMACGRGWLDLQRYVSRACYEMGSYYDPIAVAVKSELRAFLRDFPGLPDMTLMDDTATANAETQAWLREVVSEASAAHTLAPPSLEEEQPQETVAGQAPDALELARQAIGMGRPQEGVEILSREIARERSGRGRFHRKVQLAQLCLSMGREAIAYPILKDLAGEIEHRKLEEWEASDAVAHPLTLLFACVAKLDGNHEEKQRLYNWICRLDPAQAMTCSM